MYFSRYNMKIKIVGFSQKFVVVVESGCMKANIMERCSNEARKIGNGLMENKTEHTSADDVFSFHRWLNMHVSCFQAQTGKKMCLIQFGKSFVRKYAKKNGK